MSPRKRLRGYSFHSVKGGVGKSTLAVACALSCACLRPERPVYLIDFDLTGTSLADVLPLRAPFWQEGGSLDQPLLPLGRPPNGFLHRGGSAPITAGADLLDAPESDDTRTRIERREDRLHQADSSDLRPGHVPFLNDYLLYQPEEDWQAAADIDPRHLCWSFPDGPENLHVLPSSALPSDLERIVPVVFDEYYAGFLEGRCEWLLAALLADPADEIVVVADAPPSIPGLSRALISLGLRLAVRGGPVPLSEGGAVPAALQAADIRWRSALVTTLDLQDLCATARWHNRASPADREQLDIVVNRVPADWSQSHYEIHWERLRQRTRLNVPRERLLVVDRSPALELFQEEPGPDRFKLARQQVAHLWPVKEEPAAEGGP